MESALRQALVGFELGVLGYFAERYGLLTAVARLTRPPVERTLFWRVQTAGLNQRAVDRRCRRVC